MTEPKQHRLQTSIQIPLHTRSTFHERVYCLWGRLVYGLLLVGPQYFFLFQGYLLFDSRALIACSDPRACYDWLAMHELTRALECRCY